jgi:hypothetical protein
MRANSSVPGLIAAVLAALAGCKPPENSVTLVVPPDTVEPLEPGPDPPLPAEPTLPRSPVELEELLRQVEQLRSAPSESPSQAQINEIRERPQSGVPTQAVVPLGALPSPRPQKLFFQCADDVTFAVRTAGGRLEVFPPGSPNNFVALLPRPSEPGTHYYTADRAEFRFDGELATLILGPDRWADCVSNPAAAVWGARP